MQSLAVITEAEKTRFIFPASFVTRAGAHDLGVANQTSPDMNSEKHGQGNGSTDTPWHWGQWQ